MNDSIPHLSCTTMYMYMYIHVASICILVHVQYVGNLSIPPTKHFWEVGGEGEGEGTQLISP